ncbi:ATP-binding protein [Oceanospirillum sp.]|uniref:ATP-binding protein n=1 Tax=Oceanospirillum sp. TaxID=2021254 RepID=UPI003A92B760
MSQLLRIVLINTHLNGVVELQLDEHANICGTNASGKTTLQRLVPVFYGELPNRVVPKTRKKFDEFYLPFTNSYIIYEYQRDSGEICQAVLLKKSDGGLEYRLVGIPYQSEHYLQDNGKGEYKAYSYSEWASIVRHQAAGLFSPKISATSEYRSIIQNDTSALRGSNAESIKLHRLATSFSLVSGPHKLRHIEKLVSAVHAKEGKMDTLKAMLAAIFEEDGVILPATKVKNTKAREWIQQMRQSKGLNDLQQKLDGLKQLARQLDGLESQLTGLQPQLQQDQQQQLQKKADSEEILHGLRKQISHLKETFQEQESDINSSLSKAGHDLKETQARLDRMQQRFDDYEAQDMPQLQRDSDALPLWRENLQELQEQHQLMAEQHGDLERQLDLRKIKLSEALDRHSEQHSRKVKTLQQEKDKTRESQDNQLAELDQSFQNRFQQQQELFAEQKSEYQSAIAVLESQLNAPLETEEEREALAEADARLEEAQQVARQHQQQVQRSRQALDEARTAQQQADDQLGRQRQRVQQAESERHQLQRQLTPEQGSLRHFLRLNYPNWEQTLGKVVAPELLERSDLQPRLSEALSQATDSVTGFSQSSLYGLLLELNVLDLPDYAQDEAAIQHRIQQAEQQLAAAKAGQADAEKTLRQCHESFETAKAALEQVQWQQQEYEQNIDYVRDARDRLREQQTSALSARKQQLADQWNEKKQQLEGITSRQQLDLQAMKEDHQSQRLELKSDWQGALQQLDDQIEQMDQQLAQRREENRKQLKELQQAFDEELSAKGIDPKRLSELKQRQQQLKGQIQQTEERQDLLRQWQDFMQVDWQQRRPQLLAEETELKQQQRHLQQALTELKTDFSHQSKQLESDKQQQQNCIRQAEEMLVLLQNVLGRLDELELLASIPADQPGGSDLTERLARANEALELRSQQLALLDKEGARFENKLNENASREFIDRLEHEKSKLPDFTGTREQLPILTDLLHILKDQQQQLLEMGENIGGDLKKFFDVFSDINRRINRQSRRLSDAVSDDLILEGISRSEVRILSTIDELGFWQPLKHFAKLYGQWRDAGHSEPSDEYLDALSDVAELLRSDEQYSFESLLRLELHLSEGGSDLVIKNDRQLLESSSHGMAYLILCKYLLAFTRLLKGDASVTLHWPIDEIGTLAYHNVEKLFQACSSNQIVVVGAFPNPESDVLMLFRHRYLIEADQASPNRRQLKRIQPKISKLAERLAEKQASSAIHQETPLSHQETSV